ncbi:RluA family pseudouridine synthase [Camelliibacillus cellulosilyticus]|uniref:Pseudouridine synthase n=1 Tax=Camelliibacillus cellulosilyticus TaxID=2174486 RepID=A0ABV9GTU6_9BACL
MAATYIIRRTIDHCHEGLRLRDYLHRILHLSRRTVKGIKFDGGALLVNGRPQSVRYFLRADDELTVVFPPERQGFGLYAEPMDLDIVYEDDALLVVHKPAGLVTVPSFQHRVRTLASGVLYYLKEKGLASTVHPVTRLDRDTSGLVLFAKHGFIHERLAQAGDLQRRYIAVAHGHLLRTSGIIDLPIGRKEGSIIERAVRGDGKRALTRFRVFAKGSDWSAAVIRLETGRTHQIRVHFAHIGHPLLGDDLYGGPMTRIRRQALHSYRLTLRHPLTEEVLTFRAPLPEDMRRLLGTPEVKD